MKMQKWRERPKWQDISWMNAEFSSEATKRRRKLFERNLQMKFLITILITKNKISSEKNDV